MNHFTHAAQLFSAATRRTNSTPVHSWIASPWPGFGSVKANEVHFGLISQCPSAVKSSARGDALRRSRRSLISHGTLINAARMIREAWTYFVFSCTTLFVRSST